MSEGNSANLELSTEMERVRARVAELADLYGRGVAERKRAEEELRKMAEDLEQHITEWTAEFRAASAYARSLIEASLDPLVTISPDGQITDVNKATELVTGSPASD